jgi:hypothetical protein
LLGVNAGPLRVEFPRDIVFQSAPIEKELGAGLARQVPEKWKDVIFRKRGVLAMGGAAEARVPEFAFRVNLDKAGLQLL